MYDDIINMILNVLLIVIYTLTWVAIAVLFYLIYSYLRGKPLGRQTLFDLLVCDMLRVEIVVLSFTTVGEYFSAFAIKVGTCIAESIRSKKSI